MWKVSHAFIEPEGFKAISRCVSEATPPDRTRKHQAFLRDAGFVWWVTGGVVASLLDHRLMALMPPASGCPWSVTVREIRAAFIGRSGRRVDVRIARRGLWGGYKTERRVGALGRDRIK